MDNKIYGICYSEQTYILRPEHMNGQDRLFGGQLLLWIDEIAGIAARRFCKGNVTTACIDNLNFIDAAHLNDTVTLTAGVTYVGKTSMEVTVLTYAEKLDGEPKLINEAHLVEVALDENEKPKSVPEFIPTTPEAVAVFEKGRMRYELRKERRLAGI